MDSQQRAALIRNAIADLNTQGEGYLILSDAAEPENFVQLTAEGLIEVTSRNFRSSTLPRLTEAQIADIVALGFSAEAAPNHSATFVFEESEPLVELCERLFSILGTPADFTLEVELGV